MRSNLTKLLATEGLLPESVTTDKIADGAVTLNKLSSDLAQYRETPQQVGRWIDGQPIYRVAIQKTLSSSALSNRVYSLSKEDIGVNILDEVSAILNAEFGQYDNYADSTVKVPCEMDIGFTIKLYDTNLNVLKGYIEFVTVEENITS